MQARVQKWGNSLALRIPKLLADELGIRENGIVELCLWEGQLVIQARPAPSMTLERLLASITDENIHAEMSMGQPAGQEVW